MKLEMKQRMEQTDFKKLADEFRLRLRNIGLDAEFMEIPLPRVRELANAIEALLAERDELLLQNDAACRNEIALRAKLAKATEALTKLADKWQRRECMTDAYQLAANELRAALDKIKETTNAR